MAGASPQRALREFLRRGGTGRDGLDDLARRVQRRRRDLLGRHRLDGTLDEVRRLLEEAVLAERKTHTDNLAAMRAALEAGDATVTDESVRTVLAQRTALDAELDQLQARVTELEAEQATENEAGKSGKKADAAGRAQRLKQQARKDAQRDRELLIRKRKDSRNRQLRRAMDARLDLEMNARRYLDEEDITNADLRRLDDAGVMKRIVLKLAPEAKLDGKNPEQIRARYDAEVERAPAFTMEAARDMALGKLGGGGGSGSGGGQRQDGQTFSGDISGLRIVAAH